MKVTIPDFVAARDYSSDLPGSFVRCLILLDSNITTWPARPRKMTLARAGNVIESTPRLAAEFLLRKNYRSDWQSEVMEEYTYFTQGQFEATFARLGLRLLASFPIHNPWIVQHRFDGHCALQSLEGEALEYPATNYLIVGEKSTAGRRCALRSGRRGTARRFFDRALF